MAGTAAAGQKRRRPPMFQHLPLNRAKKLKQSWVKNQKIKSKWKARKRKEGLLTTKSFSPASEEDGDEGHGYENKDDDSTDGSDSDQEDAGNASVREERDDQQEKPSLRELQNQAYSRSSLHTFMSASSRRHRGPSTRDFNGRGCGQGGHLDDARARGCGRGQPDMRLRMNAMLEQIKRDYA
ncbi:hypothetical protein BC835DRAFT_1300729 [Cytidiella melzeri]|nr:hypothetical protein BC835DRAFT_1300729 [Cytidiella melzeri]